jgi:hypothetical protein
MTAMTGPAIAAPAPRIPRVVTTPTAKSTAQLMKETDGMLDRLDKLIASLDQENWDAVGDSIGALIGNAEELAALRLKRTPVARRYEFKRLLGDLVLDLHGMGVAVAKKDRAAAMGVYTQVRNDCESCHDAFRWTKK